MYEISALIALASSEGSCECVHMRISKDITAPIHIVDEGKLRPKFRPLALLCWPAWAFIRGIYPHMISVIIMSSGPCVSELLWHVSV